ncbi:MAG: hypothetical protein ACE5FF_04695 [Saprospiraceae bacterium]
MNQLSQFRTLGLAFFLLCQLSAFTQSQIIIDSQTDSLTIFRLDSLDLLTELAGDTAASHPYYTFLWIFGDGSFINGTRDSIIGHVFEKREGRLWHMAASGGADVTVYATGNYSGGSRPPRMAPGPHDFFRSPSVVRQTIKKDALLNMDTSPVPVDTSVIDSTRTNTLRLQLSKNVRPQDTLVSIVSFRQPGKVPVQPIHGQVFLFYNSRVVEAERLPPAVKNLFKTSPPPPPPPALTHGRFDFQRSLVQFEHVQEEGEGSTAGTGITEFNNLIVWNYSSLTNDGRDERHLFAEFGVDSIMWDLFKNGRGDTLRFLAVMTALDFSPDVPGPLPDVQSVLLDTTGIAPLLSSRFYNNGTFVDLDQADLQSKIIGVSEVTTPVVSAHDPNYLALYACECPDTVQRKVVGVVDYSNDGLASTGLVKVILHVPIQLNLESAEAISLVPAPAVPVAPEVNLGERTVTWSYPALLQPAESAGYGHPSTQGQLVFSITVKEGFGVADLGETTACIVFDVNDPMCTVPVAATAIVTTAEGGVAQSALQCQECKIFPEEGATCDWWCYLKWAFYLLILVVVVWLVRKLF